MIYQISKKNRKKIKTDHRQIRTKKVRPGGGHATDEVPALSFKWRRTSIYKQAYELPGALRGMKI